MNAGSDQHHVSWSGDRSFGASTLYAAVGQRRCRRRCLQEHRWRRQLSAVNTGLTSSSVLALEDRSFGAGDGLCGHGHRRCFKSTNGGGTSGPSINAGLTATSVRVLAIDPSAPATLYRARRARRFQEHQRGRQLDGDECPASPHPTVNDLAIDPSIPARSTPALVAGCSTTQSPRAVVPGRPLSANGGRFRVTTEWSTRVGQTGQGQAVRSRRRGLFNFFNTGNVEMAWSRS